MTAAIRDSIPAMTLGVNAWFTSERYLRCLGGSMVPRLTWSRRPGSVDSGTRWLKSEEKWVGSWRMPRVWA